MLLDVLDKDLWRRCDDGAVRRWTTFPEFCREVLKTTPDDLILISRVLPKKQARLKAKIELLTIGPVGGHVGQDLDNINIKTQGGTSDSYGYRRLKKEGHTDLLKRVDDEEISVNAAMIQEGLRRPKASVFVDTPDAAIQGLLLRFTKAKLLKALQEAPDG